MCNISHPKFPWKICAKNVHNKDKAVQCNLCELGIHSKCNNLNCLDYRYLQNCDESGYCIECCSTIFLFNLSSNKNFLTCTNTDSNIMQRKGLENNHNRWLKPSSNKSVNQGNKFNSAVPENGNDPDKIA